MNLAREVSATGLENTSSDFWLAVRDSLPVVLGIVPFGFTCGIMGLTAGMTPLEIILMSLLVFAGAAQFISINMLAVGVQSWKVIVLTTLLINLRHLLMGASLAPYMRELPLGRQALLAFGMADESYAITVGKTHRDGYSPSYHLGTNMAMYIIWNLSTVGGIFLGSYIDDPLRWGLDFAMPATFLLMLMPRLIDRISLWVALVAAIVAVSGAIYLPGKWYIILACICASAVGGLMEEEANVAD